jgi:hypothetical protein
MKKRIK